MALVGVIGALALVWVESPGDEGASVGVLGDDGPVDGSSVVGSPLEGRPLGGLLEDGSPVGGSPVGGVGAVPSDDGLCAGREELGAGSALVSPDGPGAA
ncbi:hypothetical protein FF041_05715, partial [Streptomyces jumonjinensis]|nr:hypothetical protein [Streptomyces jumonjinensis]